MVRCGFIRLRTVYNIIVIKPGERVPVDAEIIEGRTTLDTKALTGEAMPKEARVGDLIYSGTINLSGVIEAKVLKTYEESTVFRVMEMVEDAQNHKAEKEGFVKKFAGLPLERKSGDHFCFSCFSVRFLVF